MTETRPEQRCEAWVRDQCAADEAHGFDHIQRVVANARTLGSIEGGDLGVIIPAAWLHDCVAVAKNDPNRSRASSLAADKAVSLLRQWGVAADRRKAIAHAIEAHSFSAGIEPRTLEARVVQDADRLDALGAIGIVRTLSVGQSLGLELHHADDPFCRHRSPDDSTYIIDHFYRKLLKLPAQMQTEAGRLEGQRRVSIMQDWLTALEREISASSEEPRP